MGADNMVGFHYWQRWQDIARLMPIAIVSRPGSAPARAIRDLPAPSLRTGFRKLTRRCCRTLAPPAWVYLKSPLDKSSSTAIREGRA
jgi:nicotinate-nucleotide adenylyltransferase